MRWCRDGIVGMFVGDGIGLVDIVAVRLWGGIIVAVMTVQGSGLGMWRWRSRKYERRLVSWAGA